MVMGLAAQKSLSRQLRSSRGGADLVRKKFSFHHCDGAFLRTAFPLLLCFSNSFRFPWYTLFSVLISGFVLLLRFVFDFGARHRCRTHVPQRGWEPANSTGRRIPTASVLLHTIAFLGKNRFLLLSLGFISLHLPLALFRVQI
jgi:hypothetical protein